MGTFAIRNIHDINLETYHSAEHCRPKTTVRKDTSVGISWTNATIQIREVGLILDDGICNKNISRRKNHKRKINLGLISFNNNFNNAKTSERLMNIYEKFQHLANICILDRDSA